MFSRMVIKLPAQNEPDFVTKSLMENRLEILECDSEIKRKIF